MSVHFSPNLTFRTQDGATRWRTKKKMEDRVLGQIQVIKRVLEEQRHPYQISSWQETETIRRAHWLQHLNFFPH